MAMGKQQNIFAYKGYDILFIAGNKYMAAYNTQQFTRSFVRLNTFPLILYCLIMLVGTKVPTNFYFRSCTNASLTYHCILKKASAMKVLKLTPRQLV